MSETGPKRSNAGADWLTPPEDQQGLSAYVETLRERFWVLAITLAVATAAAVLYVTTAEDVYKAEADILVSPVPSFEGSPALGLPLIRESSDPTRDIETASRLITTEAVARRVKEDLDSPLSAQDLLDDVDAEPVAQSQLVAVTAEGETAESASELANAFAEQAVAERIDQLQAVVERQGAAVAASGAGARAVERDEALLGRLASASELQVATPATPPERPASPRRKLSLAAGIAAGLVLGVALAFAWQAIDPRLRREEQLRRRYRLPILGRIPQQARSPVRGPIAPGSLSASSSEAFRTLRGTLTSGAHSGSRSILVTGSSPAEGKSTTAINLASALAAGGKSVILIEGDLRKPTIARSLEVTPEAGLVSVLIESVSLEDALTETETFGARLRLLLADYQGDWISELFTLPAAQRLIDDAKAMADYVVIDSPPLADVIDVLPLAKHVDGLLLVARLGHTRIKKLSELADLLAENSIRPAGFALVGTARPSRSSYQYYVAQGGRLSQPRASGPPASGDRKSGGAQTPSPKPIAYGGRSRASGSPPADG